MRFRMVDRITIWEPGRRITGSKLVSFEEYMLPTALGQPERLPESLVLESFFQLGNWLILLTSDFEQMGLALRVESAEFVAPVGPGQRLDLDVAVRSYREDAVLFDGTGEVDGRVVARGTGCLAALVPSARYEDPADLRVLHESIYRPVGG